MGVLVQQVGGIIAVGKAVEGSLTLTSEMEKVDEEGLEVREERKSEMACLNGALMKKRERWEPLILLEPSCASRFACVSGRLFKYYFKLNLRCIFAHDLK